MVHEIARRIPESSGFRIMADSAFGAVDAFRAKIADIRSDRRFSDQGHMEKIRVAAKNGPLEYLASLRQQIEIERASLAGRRAHFALPPPPDDPIAEMRQREYRDWLRGLDVVERVKHATSHPEIAAAVVNSPPQLSGLPGDIHERAKTFLLEHLHGPALAVLRQETEIVDTVGVAIDVAEQQLRNEFEPPKQSGAKAA